MAHGRRPANRSGSARCTFCARNHSRTTRRSERPSAAGLGLELQGMIVVARKLKAAFGIGAGALALIVLNKVPLQ